MAISEELLPADIRRIREKLGLSQVEAGELLGGGPRAFTKYESGSVRPAASTANLLRFLDADPSAITTLSGGKVTPAETDDVRPLEVTGKHITALSPRRFMLLMRRLLDGEALASDLPMDGVHVAANINAPDGGEDARIEWTGGEARTRFLPSRLTQFQLKAGEISPARAGADVLTEAGEVKPMVRDALEKGGTYVMVCTHPYEKKLIKARADKIRSSLAAAGLDVEPERVQFRDADQLASWVNVLPSVAAWVLEHTQPGLVGPFKGWSHWAGRYDQLPWVEDDRLPEFRANLRRLVCKPRGVARVVGLSGIGKSRLTHEALGPTDEEENSPRISDLVLYAAESESTPGAIKSIVQGLADSGFRAILVVDRCPAESHQDLAAMVKRTGSRVSLVTIDHELPSSGRLGDDTLLIKQAGDPVIEGMIKQIAPDLPSEDHRRLLRFARGFPQIANLLGQSWLKTSSIASATDEQLVDRVLLGRKSGDDRLLREAGMLLGAFRLLGVKDDLNDLELIAPFSRGWKSSDIRAALDDLQRRGVVQLHGRLVSLQPKPIAMDLAERQWRYWDQKQWDEVLVGNLPDWLRRSAAHQLTLLNDRQISLDVARHVARLDGRLSSFEALSESSDVVAALAEIDAEATVALLEHVIQPLAINDVKAIEGRFRRYLVRALEVISFLRGTFERGALLLLKLAVAENEKWSNNATGQFKALFPVLVSNSEASGDARLRLLDDLLRANDPISMPIVISALLQAANTQSHYRLVGPETHGSRPALAPWQPKTWNEAWDFIVQCLDRLAQVSLRKDAYGSQARSGMGHQFRALVAHGLIDHVEGWVATVRSVHPYWPEALNALGDILQYDRAGLKEGVEARVRALIDALTPQGLENRVRFLVTEMPWDYPIDEQLSYEERGKRQAAAVEEVARELLAQPDELKRLLSQLSTGDQRMVQILGTSLAKFADNPLDLEQSITEAYSCVPEAKRNFGLLLGYYVGLQGREPAAVEAFKNRAAESSVFGVTLPSVCLYLGITPGDVLLACRGLKAGAIPVRSIGHWGFGGVFSKLAVPEVTPLLDLLLDMDGEAYLIGLDLMGMYVYGDADRLEALRPQLVKAAENLSKRGKQRNPRMDGAHHFEQMMGWLLKKGRHDADARTVAAALAKHIANDTEFDAREFLANLLPILLKTFAPIVWPPIGQVIAKGPGLAWHVERSLGDMFSMGEEKHPAILHVPEEVLLTWTHANPEVGPAFLARILPVLTTRKVDAEERAFHPMVLRLLNEFGERDDVRAMLVQNMHTFGWTGSTATYYALYEKPLQSLFEHPVGAVRRWAQVTFAQMRKHADSAKRDDDERDALSSA